MKRTWLSSFRLRLARLVDGGIRSTARRSPEYWRQRLDVEEDARRARIRADRNPAQGQGLDSSES